MDKAILSGLIIMTLVLSGCMGGDAPAEKSGDRPKQTVKEKTTTTLPSDGNPPPRACTREYMPVCGVDGVTYSNKCTAGDAEIAYEGECASKATPCTESDKVARDCPEGGQTVCGSDGITYANDCMACTAQVDSFKEGECSASDAKKACDTAGGTWVESAMECEGISKMVCGNMGGEFNECASACRNDPEAQICTMQCVLVCKL